MTATGFGRHQKAPLEWDEVDMNEEDTAQDEARADLITSMSALAVESAKGKADSSPWSALKKRFLK